MRLATMEERITAAAQYMRELIDAGWEYPDAQWKAATARGVEANALADEYDNQSKANRRSAK